MADEPTSVVALRTIRARKGAEQHGVGLEDFYAYMPMHKYICAPSREVWPAASVNARLPPVVGPDDKSVPAAAWLDANAAVEQMT